MKKLCFFMFLLFIISSKTLANAHDLKFESDTLQTDRTILLNLKDLNGKSIRVNIRKQDGSLVFTDKLKKIHTDTQKYILNEMEQGVYLLELKSKTKRFLQKFSITNEELQISVDVSGKSFNPVLNMSRQDIDITTQVKEQWYQHIYSFGSN